MEIRPVALDCYGMILSDYLSIHCTVKTGYFEDDPIFWQTLKWLDSGKIKDWPRFRFWTLKLKLPSPPKVDLRFLGW